MNNTNQTLLKYSLELLNKHSFLEYSGEYGAEITTFIPFVAWLKQEGHLRGHRIISYECMRPYYFFLDEDEFSGKHGERKWVPVRNRYWPSNSTYTATASPWHVYPDFRQRYASSGINFDKPVIFIQNKFTVEWKVGPINFLPLNGLRHLIELAKDKFDIVYSRPGIVQSLHDYSKDHQAFCEYPDRDILREHEHVIDFESYCSKLDIDYNLTKLEILAKTRMFIATQGGGAHILACFGESILLLLDRSGNMNIEGHEYPHAYQHGPYKYLSKNPPALFVARTFDEFNTAIDAVVGRVTFLNSRISFPLTPTLQRIKL